MASKKSKAGVNKSQFVREQDLKLSAAEVVEKAKAKGIELSAAFVYSIRSAAKTAANKGAPKVGKVGRPAKVAATGLSGLSGMDAAIRAIVREEIRAIFSKLG